jgi:hypothetical protein
LRERERERTLQAEVVPVAAVQARPAATASSDWNWKDDDNEEQEEQGAQPAARVKARWDALLEELEALEAPLDGAVQDMAASRLEGAVHGWSTQHTHDTDRACELPLLSSRVGQHSSGLGGAGPTVRDHGPAHALRACIAERSCPSGRLAAPARRGARSVGRRRSCTR